MLSYGLIMKDPFKVGCPPFTIQIWPHDLYEISKQYQKKNDFKKIEEDTIQS
jgi:hypothetical protein